MLLLLPFDKKIEKNRFPIVTILLVLINTVIFFGFQFGDDDKYQKALDYYLESDLPDYEFPLYLQYLKDHNDDDYYYVKKWHDQNKKYTYYFMLSNGVFMKKMLSEELSVGIKEVREKWRKQRDEFEEKLNESVTYKYALIPADHRPVTFLTYQFLHGSTMHLIGNMIFLFVLGFSLEAVYGSIKFTVIYLLCGVGAASFYFVFNAGSMVHMVGASGAIAGFMGLYAVTYGLRQIRFFYNVLFYVDYIKAPALIMLPLWLMNEIIQNVSSNTNVAYTAHIGGILSGAAIGAIFKLLNKGIDEEYLDENINLEEYNKQLDVANGYFNRLDFNRARRCYYQILEQFEAGFDILKKIYSLETSPKGTEDGYKKIVNIIFSFKPQNPSEVTEIRKIFIEYYKKMDKKVNLASEQYLKLSIIFSEYKYFDVAEKIIVTTVNSGNRPESLAHAIVVFAENIAKRDSKKAAKYLTYLVKNFVDTEEAEYGKELLQQIG